MHLALEPIRADHPSPIDGWRGQRRVDIDDPVLVLELEHLPALQRRSLSVYRQGSHCANRGRGAR
ncbi:MAG: hypothetical protein U5K37_02345 [Natrialbaceae archaeon]|nr:hypothetical protein [Natrialbaceae archaeon]